MTSTFGDIFVASQIVVDAQTTLKKWFSSYLREIERRLELEPNSVQDPITYNSRNTTELLPGEQLPKCVVISPGLFNRPAADGAGKYRAVWRLAVGIAFSDEDEETARLKVDCYAAAARAIILNKLRKETNLNTITIEWMDESYEDLNVPGGIKQLKAAVVHFIVDIGNVASKRGGPDEPTDESSTLGQVVKTVITFKKEPINA